MRGDAFVSSAPGEITRLGRRAAEGGASLVVVVGGDGTVNEAVNGMLEVNGAALPELAVIMVGTGKGVAHSHGIPTRLDDALAVASGGRTAAVDVGRVRHRSWHGAERDSFFVNVASAGMSGAVARRADAGSKALGGRLTYFLALVQVFARWENVEMTVDVGGERRHGRMTNVVVSNGAFHAGGMWLAPGAVPDDGLFDVVLFGDISKLDFVRDVVKVYRGTHLSHPKIELIRAVAVAVDAPDPLPLELDGEQPGTTPARFDVVPRALRLRVPP